MELDAVVQRWDDAGRSDEAQARIHPAGNLGEDEYDQSGMDSAQTVLELAELWLPSGIGSPRIVDFGCGDGRVLRHLTPHFDDLWGVDASPAMLERLQARVPGVNPWLSNGTDGQMEGLGADMIFSMAVFIHHSWASGEAMIGGLTKGLAKDGILALEIPCYDVPREGDSWISVTTWHVERLLKVAKRYSLVPLETWSSPDWFVHDEVGLNHGKLQVFKKPW